MRKRPKHVTFSIYGSAEQSKSASTQILTTQLFDPQTARPLEHGPLAPRLGAQQKDDLCVVCNASPMEELGHEGTVPLGKKVHLIAPVYGGLLRKLLYCLCPYCKRSPLAIPSGATAYHNLDRLDCIATMRESIAKQREEFMALPSIYSDSPPTIWMNAAFDVCKRRRRCYHCFSELPSWRLQGHGTIESYTRAHKSTSDTNVRTWRAEELRELLLAIPNDVYQHLGINTDRTHTANVVLSSLPYPPGSLPSIRRSGAVDFSVDKFASQMIKIGERARALNESDAKYASKRKTLQLSLDTIIIGSNASTAAAAEQGNDRKWKNKHAVAETQAPTVRDRLNSKQGVVRSAALGMRVDESARLVVVGDPYLLPDTVGIPDEVAMKLCIEEVVSTNPVERTVLQRACKLGMHQVDGARYITRLADGTTQFLRPVQSSARTKKLLSGVRVLPQQPHGDSTESLSIEDDAFTSLQVMPGDIVGRHMGSAGGSVFVVRAPVLRANNVLLMKTITNFDAPVMRMSSTAVGQFQGDFDGDEDQDFGTRTKAAAYQAAKLAGFKRHLMWSSDSSNHMAPVHSGILGLDQLSAADTRLTRSEMLSIASAACRADPDNKVRVYQLPPPIDGHSTWSGRQVLGMLLPTRVPCYEHNDVVIRNGEWLSGRATDKIVGCSSRSLLSYMARYLDERHLAITVARLQNAGCHFVEKRGMSLSLYELHQIAHQLAAVKSDAVAQFRRTQNAQQLMDDLDGIWSTHMAHPVVKAKGASIRHELVEQVVSVSMRTRAHQLVDGAAHWEALEALVGRSQWDAIQRRDKNLSLAQAIDLYVLDPRLRERANQLAKIAVPLADLVAFLKTDRGRESTLMAMNESGARGKKIDTRNLAFAVGRAQPCASGTSAEWPAQWFPHKGGVETSPVSKGILTTSAIDGVTEFGGYLMHAQALGDADNGAKTTSASGYKERQMTICLGGFSVQYDQTVRDPHGHIVQYKFGGDGVDPTLAVPCGDGQTAAIDPDEILRSLLATRTPADGDDKAPMVSVDEIERYIARLGSVFPQYTWTDEEKWNWVFSSDNGIVDLPRVPRLLLCTVRSPLPLTIVHKWFRLMIHGHRKTQIAPGTAIGLISSSAVMASSWQSSMDTTKHAARTRAELSDGLPTPVDAFQNKPIPRQPTIDAGLLPGVKLADVTKYWKRVRLADWKPMWVMDSYQARWLAARDIWWHMMYVDDEQTPDIANSVARIEISSACMNEVGLTHEDLHGFLQAAIDHQNDLFSLADVEAKAGAAVSKAKKRALKKKKALVVDEKETKEDDAPPLLSLRSSHVVPTYNRMAHHPFVAYICVSALAKNNRQWNVDSHLRRIRSDLMVFNIQGWSDIESCAILPTSDQSIRLFGTPNTKTMHLHLLDVMNTPGVDPHTCTSNNLRDVLNVLDIEATRHQLFTMLCARLRADDKYVDRRHLGLICDYMCRSGQVSPITRFAVELVRFAGPLMKLAMEEQLKNAAEHAFFGRVDDLSDVLACQMMNSQPRMGTTAFDLHVDREILAKHGRPQWNCSLTPLGSDASSYNPMQDDDGAEDEKKDLGLYNPMDQDDDQQPRKRAPFVFSIPHAFLFCNSSPIVTDLCANGIVGRRVGTAP